MRWAFFLAAASAGKSIAGARIAMIAITTRSSISVNAALCLVCCFIDVDSGSVRFCFRGQAGESASNCAETAQRISGLSLALAQCQEVISSETPKSRKMNRTVHLPGPKVALRVKIPRHTRELHAEQRKSYSQKPPGCLRLTDKWGDADGWQEKRRVVDEAGLVPERRFPFFGGAHGIFISKTLRYSKRLPNAFSGLLSQHN